MEAQVRRLVWQNEAAVIIASGPSVTQSQIAYCYKKARVIVINNMYQFAPWADVLYACDANWWKHHNGCAGFEGVKYSLEKTEYDDVNQMEQNGQTGLSLKWPKLSTGQHGGYQAINLAYHFGVKTIILIGYDMQHTGGKMHCHSDHPQGLNNPKGISRWLEHYDELAEHLFLAGVDVINCTISTALTCFQVADIREVL